MTDGGREQEDAEDVAAEAARKWKESIDSSIGASVLGARASVISDAIAANAASALSEQWRKQMREATEAIMQSFRPLDHLARAMEGQREQLQQLVVALSPQVPNLVTTGYAELLQSAIDQRRMNATMNRLIAGLSMPQMQVNDLASVIVPLRASAKKAVEQLQIPAATRLVEGVREAEDIVAASEALGADEEDRVVNPFLVLGILAVLLQFLGDQRDILETAFEDAALIGHGLAQVWEYALAVLLVALLSPRRPKAP